MPHVLLAPYVYDCRLCHTHCDGSSKGVYNFGNDSAFSERHEQLIIQKINSTGRFTAEKCKEAGYPDVAVYNLDGALHAYLEVKVQQRTFMQVEHYLPQAGLLPSETVALNLSDLLRYFSIREQTGVPVSIVWVLLHRPCIVGQQAGGYFYQTTDRLKEVYRQCGDRRRFRRRSGAGDVVEGQHKGVTVNYHFRLGELKPWRTDPIQL